MALEREKKSTEGDGQNRELSPLRGLAAPWAPGVSGNPGGRPKEVVQVKALARQWTIKAVETLARIMLDREAPARAQAAAAEALLDRGWGKPAQVIEGEGEHLIVTVKTVSGADPWSIPQKTN